MSRPNGLDYYLFPVIRSAAYCGHASESRLLSPDSVVLFDKGTPQFFGAADNNYKNDRLAFSLNGDEEQRLRSLQLPKDEFLPLPMPDFFCRITGLMYDEFALSPTADSPILKKQYIKCRSRIFRERHFHYFVIVTSSVFSFHSTVAPSASEMKRMGV